MSALVERCPLCGCEQSRLFDHRLFCGQPVVNRLCQNCGLVYQSPRMSSDELEAFYQEEYRRLYQGQEGPGVKDLAIQRLRAEMLLAFIRNVVGSISRHLDVGCSAGALLERFAQEYGCQALGIEPGVAYRLYAQQRGLKVYASLEELKAQGEQRFDLISLVHVLEHLPDPLATLVELRQGWLAPQGYVLIEVPNLYAHHCFEVAHLVSFSPHTLRQTLSKAGYQVVTFRAHGLPRSRLLPLYLTLLARPLPNGASNRVRPERAVRLKRHGGMLWRKVLERLLPRMAWLPQAEIEV